MPTLKLDDRLIRSLTANGKEREDYADLLMPGLRLRVTDKGAKSWSLIFRIKGRAAQLRKTYGKYPRVGLAEARELARVDLNKAARGEDPRNLGKPSAPTVASFAEEYLSRHVRPRLKTAYNYELILNRDVLPFWGKRLIDSIDRRDVVTLLDRIMDRGAPVLANRTLGVISALFTFAVVRCVLTINPCIGLPPPAKEEPRETVVGFESLVQLWRAAENDNLHGAWLRLKILTGKRGQETARLRWRDIGEEWWDIPGEHTKKGRPDRIFLTPLFREVLEELRPANGHRIWALSSRRKRNSPIINLDAYLRSLRPTTGVVVTGREIRAACITAWSEMGIPPHVVAALAGHALPGITRRRYDRYGYDREKREALLAWDARLQTALGR